MLRSPVTPRTWSAPLLSWMSEVATSCTRSSPEESSMRSGMLAGTLTSKSSAFCDRQPENSGILASMRTSDPLRVATSLMSSRLSRSEVHAVPVALTSAAPGAPLTRSSPARPMITMRVAPAAEIDALRGAL